MGVGERQTQKPQRRKTPSFSSSLLDTIYHSIDEEHDFLFHRRNNTSHVEEEIESLRRAIMVEKWMQNYTNAPATSLMSGSSTDSSIFSSSETESSVSSVSSVSRSSVFSKSRGVKKYADSKKAKEPVSPRGRIANFLNSVFSPRSVKKNQVLEEWNSVRKSRSMKDILTKNPSSAKRSVRFCPAVSVIVGGESASVPAVGSQFIRKNIDSFRMHEGKNQRKHELRKFYENESDVDDKSCASSDLFELESIGRIGIAAAYEEELPVYGTTNLKQLIM